MGPLTIRWNLTYLVITQLDLLQTFILFFIIHIFKIKNKENRTMSMASFLTLFFLLTLNRFYVTFWCFYCRLWTYKCRLDYGSLVYKNVRKIIRNTDHKNGWEIFLILTVWKRPGPDVNIAGKLSSFQCTYCCLSPALICSHRLLIILNMIYLPGYSNSVIARLKKLKG